MYASLILLACAAPAIDVGWQQLDDGGYEYIIQIEPELLDSLRSGRNILSDLPPSLRNIRRYRITVGNGPLPHEGVPPELVGEAPADEVVVDVVEADDADSAAAAESAAPLLLIDPRQPIPLSHLPGPGNDDRGPSPDFGAGLASDPPVAAPRPVETPLVPNVVEPPVDVATSTPPIEAQPNPLDVPNDSRPLVSNAGGASDTTPAAATVASRDDVETPQPELVGKPPVADEAAPRDWWLLTAVLVGLFVSLGANLFLTWVTWGTRARYRELLTRSDLHPSPV